MRVAGDDAGDVDFAIAFAAVFKGEGLNEIETRREVGVDDKSVAFGKDREDAVFATQFAPSSFFDHDFCFAHTRSVAKKDFYFARHFKLLPPHLPLSRSRFGLLWLGCQ